MKSPGNLFWINLERLYAEGCQLFIRGNYEESIDHFKRIYERMVDFRDASEILEDFYAMPREQWVAKYHARIQN